MNTMNLMSSVTCTDSVHFNLSDGIQMGFHESGSAIQMDRDSLAEHVTLTLMGNGPLEFVHTDCIVTAYCSPEEKTNKYIERSQKQTKEEILWDVMPLQESECSGVCD